MPDPVIGRAARRRKVVGHRARPAVICRFPKCRRAGLASGVFDRKVAVHMGWLLASGGYEVTLRGAELVARNAKGKELRSVPSALRDDPVVTGLRQLTEWLGRH